MSATQFTVDMRDIRFVVHEQLQLTSTMAVFEQYAHFDQEMYDQVLDEAHRIATEVIGPLNRESDRHGCGFDLETRSVTTPPGFREAWNVLKEGGWLGLTGDIDNGGMGMPHTVGVAIGEMFTGASMSFTTYSGLARASANLLSRFAPEDIRLLVCEKLFGAEWGGTMCLTEADAGSSVGDNRTKAVRQADGSFLLTGEKIFITAGDQDLTENIVHLVLARTPDAPAGTRGLSLFLVPKFRFSKDGTLGERNNAWVTKIEEKMGLHGSATCVLTLGTEGPCTGILLGEENEGMRLMFHMMNEARIGVGLQALSGAAAAYNNAVAYAKERIQGTRLRDFRNPEAPRVAIVEHADVRRMLMHQRVLVETMRSLVYSTAMRLDRALISTDTQEHDYLLGLVELMTPIVKAHCSDRAFDVTVLALQTYGGAGYTGEYPVEQLLRDTKISSIYEGTNGIQAMDLVGRKLTKGAGRLLMNWMGEAQAELARCQEAGVAPEAVKNTEKAVQALGASAMHLGAVGQEDMEAAMLYSSPFLEQFGTVVLGLHALLQARLAQEFISDASGSDQAFYTGKMRNAEFYAAHILPRSVALGKTIRSSDTSCLDPVLFQ